MDSNNLQQPLLDEDLSVSLGEKADVLTPVPIDRRDNNSNRSTRSNKIPSTLPVTNDTNAVSGSTLIHHDNSYDTVGTESSLMKESLHSNNQLHSLAFYSKTESGDTEIDIIDVPSHRSSMISDEGISEGGGKVLGDDSPSTEFETVGSGVSYGWTPSTSNYLEICRKYNLRYYHILLKLIGWRKFRNKYGQTPWYLSLANFLYPLFMFVMLVFACGAQVLACFGRDTSLPPTPIGNGTRRLDCESHILTNGISSYIFILLSYVGGFYIFRKVESEHLSALAETVFLSFNYASMRRSQKRPVIVLLAYFIFGSLWLAFSFGVSVLRLFALQLDKNSTIIEWFYQNNSNHSLPVSISNYEVFHYIFVAAAMLGFVFFDLLYIAIMINFCYQCQLLKYYLENIIDKVKSRKYNTFDDACKEIYHVYEFLKVLNGKVAFVMTLVIIVFLTNIISSYQNLQMTKYKDTENIILGFLNVIQWLSITAFPVIVATQFTATANDLRRVGLYIASRPYVYSDCSELELQYFLNFTQSANFSARIAFIPMYPSLVVGSMYLLVLMVTVGIGVPRVDSVYWF